MLSLTNSLSVSDNFSYLDITPFTKVQSSDELFFKSLRTDDISTSCTLQSVNTCENITNVEKLHLDDSTELLLKDIVKTISQYQFLQELSLSYSLLSDELLTALSCDDQINLKTMKIEVYPDEKPLPHISDKTWLTLENHLPDLNVVLTSYLSDEDNCNDFLITPIPVTHLFLSGSPPEITVGRISKCCTRLVELIISSYNFGLIDEPLIAAAKGCPKLSAISLGDCELTCSGLVEFVGICKERLQILLIWETSLMEDSNLNVDEAASQVSCLLGRPWIPESIPFW
ncbi:GSCOCG00003235001-RA-CDS [Cotesia congregata]|uniref:Similar to Fbxl21: F-box/LRR-repeat protein 21 (Ovis aries) n=1 Tax=Cotesia congregata TaxID=51543 RepID=A0A8J2MXB3_COTCN|nr:GSCOCG00003235001-RA-CDS [Cotesia congregata]CAG5103167.1 Similar to Fbxl21: F-box/LRR-repeat protein 21 (Ovis aries) [Cotesia congregata]